MVLLGLLQLKNPKKLALEHGDEREFEIQNGCVATMME